MRVIGFNFKQIFIEKKKEVTQNIKVGFNIEIEEVKKQEVDLFKDQDVFGFDFTFKIDYEPNYAELKFKGTILAVAEDKEIAKDIEEKWKNKQLPEDIHLGIRNTILSKCNIKALQLEEDIGLPVHMPAPRLTREQPQV